MNDLPAARELVRRQREERLSIHQVERSASEGSAETPADENAAAVAQQDRIAVAGDDDEDEDYDEPIGNAAETQASGQSFDISNVAGIRALLECVLAASWRN